MSSPEITNKSNKDTTEQKGFHLEGGVDFGSDKLNNMVKSSTITGGILSFFILGNVPI
jgi:hypothetical protein